MPNNLVKIDQIAIRTKHGGVATKPFDLSKEIVPLSRPGAGPAEEGPVPLPGTSQAPGGRVRSAVTHGARAGRKWPKGGSGM